jgi:hypothetical protein
MSADAIAPGSILHWEGFKFPDGTEANKYFVIVGAQTGKNFLAIIATSQQKRRAAQPGAATQMVATIIFLAVARIGFKRIHGCYLRLH